MTSQADLVVLPACPVWLATVVLTKAAWLATLAWLAKLAALATKPWSRNHPKFLRDAAVTEVHDESAWADVIAEYYRKKFEDDGDEWQGDKELVERWKAAAATEKLLEGRQRHNDLSYD